MGSAGNCFDNAIVESLFATLETELIDRQPRQQFRSRVEASRKIVFANWESCTVAEDYNLHLIIGRQKRMNVDM